MTDQPLTPQEQVDVEALEAKWRHHLANGSHEAHDIVGLLDKYHALQAEVEAAREREKESQRLLMAWLIRHGEPTTGHSLSERTRRALAKLDAGEEG